MQHQEDRSESTVQAHEKLPYEAPGFVSSNAFERLALACNGFISPGNPPICNPNAGPKNCGGACPSS